MKWRPRSILFSFFIFIGPWIFIFGIYLPATAKAWVGFETALQSKVETPHQTETPSQTWEANQKSRSMFSAPLEVSLTFTTTPTTSPTVVETLTPSQTTVASPTPTQTPTATIIPTIANQIFLPNISHPFPPTPTPTPTNTPDPAVTPETLLFCKSPNKSIPDDDPAGTSSTIVNTEDGIIVDLEVSLDVSHTWVGDLVFTLEHVDTGKKITLLDRPGAPDSSNGCGSDDITAILDDDLTASAETRCASSPAALSGIFVPQDELNAFQGELISGDWRLTASDLNHSDTGKLNEWCMVAEVQASLPLPTPTPPPIDLPNQAQIAGVTGKPQSLPLDCESRSAVDWAAYYDVSIGEIAFYESLPESDNPDKGFVGNVYGQWGQIPPNDYGVHAEPVAQKLRDHGLEAYAHRPLSWDELRSEIASGDPVIVWIVGNVINGSPVYYTSSDDHLTVVAHYEHTVIVTGYTKTTVTYLNGSTTYSRSLDQFLDSWSTMRNMAITTKP